MNALTIFLGCLVIVPLALGVALVTGLWWVWWIYPGWDWFLVPLGLPHVTLWQLWGIYMMLRARHIEWPAPQPLKQKPRDVSDYAAYALGLIIGPIVTWAVLRWLAGV